MKPEKGEQILARHFPKLNELIDRSTRRFCYGMGFGLILALVEVGSITNEQFTRLNYWLDCANELGQS